MKKNHKEIKIPLIISIFILIIQITYAEEIQGLQYPNLFTLLSQNILMVASDGIHFYNSNLGEDLDKKIDFEKEISSNQENDKICIVQFSENDGGYIIILAMNKLYFFYPDGTIINSFSFTEEAEHYCINPYKLEDNYLYYIITYPINTHQFIINYNKFNLKSKEIENIKSSTIDIITKTYGNAPDGLFGIKCIILSNSLIDEDIFSCFYSIKYPNEFHGRSFLLSKDNINEKTEYFKYYQDSNFLPSTISVIADPKKEQAFLYMGDGSPYTQTFNLTDGFSKLVKHTCQENLKTDYSQSKLFYFRQIHEYLCVSSTYNLCTIFLMSFNDDFSFKNKTTFLAPKCYYSFSFSAYFNGVLYTVVNDNINNEQKIIQIETVENLGTIEVVEQPIIIDNNNMNVKTTNIIIQTSNIHTTNLATTIPNIQSTIQKNEVKTTIPIIQTTIPTIQTTNIQTTILTTIIKTTLPIIQTTIPTTIIKTTLPIIQTTIPTTNDISNNSNNYSYYYFSNDTSNNSNNYSYYYYTNDTSHNSNNYSYYYYTNDNSHYTNNYSYYYFSNNTSHNSNY